MPGFSPQHPMASFLKEMMKLETKHFQEPLLEAKSRLQLDQLGISMVD